MSDLSVCNVHAARVCERFRRAVRGAWVAFRGRAVERGGYATRRCSHDASVACRDRPTSGRCERAASRPSGGRATRFARTPCTLYVYRRARPHCAFALSRRAILCPFPAFARFGFHVSRAVPGRAAVFASRRRLYDICRYIEHHAEHRTCLDQSGTRRTRQRINVNQLRGSRVPRSARARRHARREVKRRSWLPRRPNFQCDTGLLLTGSGLVDTLRPCVLPPAISD